MNDRTFLEIPITRVRDKISGKVHDVGTSSGDRLYLDDLGRIQYIDTRTLKGTKDGAYYFVAGLPGVHPVFHPNDGITPVWSRYKFNQYDPMEYVRDELIGRIEDLQSEISEYEDDLETAQDTIDDLERRYCTR